MKKHRAGSRFIPTELGLVRRYLRNMVERNDSDGITTMNVYEDEPWRLVHVSNPLFDKNEWYYFVKRKKRGIKSTNRIVPRRGEHEGGTWKSTGKSEPIKDQNEKVLGYKKCLVYNKKVSRKPKKTNWLMTEFSLHKDGNEFQDLVLCWIRYKDRELNLGFNDAPPIMEAHQEHEQEDAPVLLLPPQNNNENDMMMNPMLSLPPPCPLGQDSGLNMTMRGMNESNDSNYLMHENNLLGESYDNNYLMHDNSSLMQNNDNNYLMHYNNLLMESYDNNYLMHENNVLGQSCDNNYLMQENNLLEKSDDNNYLMQENVNDLLSYDNNYVIHDNDIMLPMSNDEPYDLYDDFDFGDVGDMMFGVDELIQPNTYDYTQRQEDDTDHER